MDQPIRDYYTDKELRRVNSSSRLLFFNALIKVF